MGIFTIFFSFLVLVAIAGTMVVAGLIIWGVRSSSRVPHPAGALPLQAASRETPQEILARRFASGEITADEYERARDLLGGGGERPRS
jgi:putative membrane protein